MAKALVFLAEGMEECEALLVVDLLRRAQVEVITAAVGGCRMVVSSHGIPITADVLAEETETLDAQLLVLPGGVPGTGNLEADAVVLRLTQRYFHSGKLVAAICAAPSILGHLGLLEGRRATAHVHFRDQLTGAQVLDQEVVSDGNVITSYGLGGAIPFALELVERLAGREEAERIRTAIAYRH